MNRDIITLQKVNNIKVKPIPNPLLDGKKIKGEKLFKEIYSNIFLCARKQSGKTLTLFKILQKCAGRDTTIIVFCSTLNKDHTYKYMKSYFKEKKINWIGYTSLIDDGEDQLTALIEHLKKEAAEQEKREEEKENNEHLSEPTAVIDFDDDDDVDEEPKKRKSKYLAPEYIIVFDDISNELKSPSLVWLLKMNRHFKAKIIISSQYLNDLLPASRKQIDYWLIFKGHQEDKLEVMYKDADIGIDYNLFNKLYHKATEQKYSFFYIDKCNEQYRRNFDTIFNIPNH